MHNVGVKYCILAHWDFHMAGAVSLLNLPQLKMQAGVALMSTKTNIHVALQYI